MKNEMRSSRRRRTRGAVIVEYAFLLVAVFVPTAAGVVAGGVSMLRDYRAGRTHLLANTP